MGKIKLLACDLDGTLMDRGCRITATDADALKRAKTSGVCIAVCTGRATQHLPMSVRALDFIDYRITSNGARVFDVRGEKCLLLRPMPVETAVEVVRRLAPCGAAFNLHYDGYDLADDRNLRMQKGYGDGKGFMPQDLIVKSGPDILTLMAGEQAPPLKMLILFDTQAACSQAERALDGMQGIELTTSFSRTLEITAAGVRKDVALAWLCARLRIPLSDIAAVGDSDNDAEMLRLAGFGVAMGAASPGAKAAADYVTGDLADGGFVRAAEKILSL
ncbi:MAG: HAD family hydrolase [Oscillospiraceae bacterium]|nr:HAD family hydrolase [Oscillospiraceae bacterium]